MSEQNTPEPIELVSLTVPVVFEDSDKDDAYDKVDRHLRNSLDDTDYAEYSEALDTVADCSGLTNQRDELLAALTKAREDINWMINNEQFLNSFVFDYIDTAIDSVKGDSA